MRATPTNLHSGDIKKQARYNSSKKNPVYTIPNFEVKEHEEAIYTLLSIWLSHNMIYFNLRMVL